MRLSANLICDPRDLRLYFALVPNKVRPFTLVALFTFTPFLSSSVIFETFTCGRAIPRLKHPENDLIHLLIAVSYRARIVAMDHHNESSVGFQRLSVPPLHYLTTMAVYLAFATSK